MELADLKSKISKEIDSRRGELKELSRRIHDNPETALCEIKASSWLSSYLEKNDFRIERGIGGLPTAFRTSYGNGSPVIALLAEYDALPGLGHACGHNIIGVAAAGAGVAARFAVDRFGGTVIVMGTPDEEKNGGKGILVREGAFNDVDIAMMVHPDVHDNAITRALACQELYVEFFGKEAHAAASPETGINALEAMILSFNAINSLRQHVKGTARIHGVITDGGQVANVVPGHSAASFNVRAEDDKYLEELKQKVVNCFQGAAKATGARLKFQWGEVCYSAMKNNLTLANLFKNNMEKLGRKVKMTEDGTVFSTDMGNVSQVVPGLHAMVAIAPEGIRHHTPEFAKAAVSEAGIEGLLDSAKALAMTVCDLLSDKDNVQKARKEFLGN